MGCFLCEPACLFYRNYAVHVNKTVGSVFQCTDDWELQVALSVKLEKGHWSAASEVSFKLDAPKKQVDGIEYTLVSVTSPPATRLSSHFVTDGLRTAIIPNGFVEKPQLRCLTKDDAANFNCTFEAGMCECHPASNRMSCQCSEYSPLMHLSEHRQMLPTKLGSTTIKQALGKVYSEISVINVEFQVNFRNYHVAVQTDNNACDLTPEPLLGCGNCGQGALFGFSCKTDFGNNIGHVYCPSVNFSVVCDKAGTKRETYLALPSGEIDGTCSLACPTSNKTFNLYGTLHIDSSYELFKTIHVVDDSKEIQQNTLSNLGKFLYRNVFKPFVLIYIVLTL